MEGRDEAGGAVERDGGLTVAVTVAVRETRVERSGGERGGGGVGKSHLISLCF